MCISSTALVFELFMLELLQTATQSTFLPMPLYFLPRLLSSKLHSWLNIYGTLGGDILKKKGMYNHFFLLSHLSARCPCAIGPMAAIDILTMHTSYNGDMQTLSVGFTISPREMSGETKWKKSHYLFKKSLLAFMMKFWLYSKFKGKLLCKCDSPQFLYINWRFL